MKYFLSLLVFLFSSEIVAQQFIVSGKVLDENNMPVAYVNAVIFSADASKIITGSSTNEAGEFSIDKLNPGDYVLKLSFLGYETTSKPLTLSKTINIGTTLLETSKETLGEVNISVKKPTIKKLADRLVFNVENTALSEGNILDVLRNTPTVLIQDETIKIKGSTPTVYINDRKVNLSGAEILQLLESTPAGSIKAIEAITTPGAKYDAASGTVLNIVMGKNLIAGYRGRVFGGYKQGVFPSFNGGISNFYKNKKISLSANYSYSKNKNNRDNDNNISYLNADNTLNELWNSNVNRNKRIQSHNINTSLDYFINDNNTLTLSSNAVLTPHFKYSTQNKTTILDDNANLLSSFNANTLSRDNINNLGIDLDYVSKFNNNSKLSINANYTIYDYSRGQHVNSDYFLADNSFDFDTAFRTESNQDISIISSSADYYLPIDDDASLTLGVKNSTVDTNSSLIQLDIINNEEILNHSNNFDYKENVLAAYASYEDKFDDFTFTTGLRIEQTNLDGQSLNEKNTQDYFEWFPTVVLNHNTSKKLALYAKYKRSISRPNYQSLNPFEYFLNDNEIVTGNPNLQPSFSNRWDVGVIVNDKHTFEVALTTTNGNINEVPIQDNINNVITYIPTNIGKTTELAFAHDTSFTLFDKMSVYFINILYNTTETTTFENQSVKLNQWSYYSDLSGNISFLKDNSLSTSFALLYYSKILQGLVKYKGQFYSDIAISKTIWNKRGTISLIASDLFNTADFTSNRNYLNQRSSQFTDLDNRFIKLGFSYKFGNSTLETNEKDKYNKERNRLRNRD